MRYEMEELVHLVGKLAERYTAFESTSVTYEKAELLMGAVLYCIHEAEMEGFEGKDSVEGKERQQAPLVSLDRISLQKAYEMGVVYVKEKAKRALKLYNEILPDFDCYENRCLHHTFVKELPEFFKRYDVYFEPQDTIVTLDYPVFFDISGYTGIDKIYMFLVCIDREQRALRRIPRENVIHILSAHNRNYRDGVENIHGIVFAEKEPWDVR
ncbi:MAG: hypothetical protein HFG54_09920 [Lachnospiraceae bacterium]|nr:hypothetical protein [Lachnospiraceae bacterium]